MPIKQTVLVTGGAGFIGSNLCRTLLSCENSVICLDNLYSGLEENIHDLKGNPAFEFVRHDIRIPLDDFAADIIYHLACPASPQFYQKDPIYTSETNFLGTLNLLKLAEKHHTVFIHASTSEIYGDATIHPQPETYWGNVNPIGPRSCYNEGKRMAENLVLDFHKQYGTRVKIARVFNCYGPRMKRDDGRVVSTFINQALQGLPLSVNGDGQQTRSFCYVTDLIQGIIKLGETDDTFTGLVNLGNPEEISMKELAELIIKLTASSSSIEYRSMPVDDPKKRKPDIRLAKERLGWAPTTNLQEGLRKTIQFYLY